MMISTHGYVSANPEFGKLDTGGQVVYVLELAKCLARFGFDVDIYTRQFEDQLVRDVINDRVKVLRIPCGGPHFIPKEVLCKHIPEWVENAHAYIKDNEINYAFINSHYWDAGLAGRLLSNHVRIPHVHTPHSIGAWKCDNMDGSADELEGKYNFRERIREEKLIYDESDVLIATTPRQRDILRAGKYDVPAEKIHVIPPGYDNTRFFPVSLATRRALKQDLDAHGPIVLALGRMAHNKGYDLLIRAMPFVIERVPEARLILAVRSTDPSHRELEQIEELRALARSLRIERSVIFRGYIPDERLPDYYHIANVFALSSRYEPFGMTAVEAMACGTPTVITTEGGLWKLVTWGKEAFYASPFDSSAFGDAISTVLHNPRVAAQMAKYGSQKAQAQFTWTGIAQQLLRVLEAVASRVCFDIGQEPQSGPRSAWAVDPSEEELWKTAFS
jgi:mannosylfructose-phosphate synthase